MKTKIIKLEEQMPHLSILLGNGNALVVPVRYIEELINGKQKIVITEDNEPLIRHIIKEWYENVKNKQQLSS